MDGNGRWAKKFDHPRNEGHRNGLTAVRETVEICSNLGIKALTLYAFSTENWGRPEDEVDFLMRLFEGFLRQELPTMLKNNIRFMIIGDKKNLPDFVQEPLKEALEKTKDNQGMVLSIAINYGSRKEIIMAFQQIVKKIQEGKLSVDHIDEKLISGHLYTSELSDPDLIIRTSGEQRLSNFLLWQSAYAELYFTETLWPDFNRDELYLALETFSQRERRLGKV